MSGLLGKSRTFAAHLYKGSRQPRWAMASQVATSGANFATTLIIVRSLGLEEFGRFSVCFLLMMIARNFLNGLVLTPMSTIAPRLGGRAQAGYRGFLAVNGMAFSLGSSVLLYALAVPLGVALNAPWLPELALAMALANFTANGADFVRRYHFVQNAPLRAFAVDAIRFGVQLGLLLGLALYWQDGFSASTALYAMAIGGFAGLVAGVLHYGITRWSNRLSRAVWPRHWNFIKWMTPGVALESMQSSGLFLIGAVVLGTSALGIVRTIESLANIIVMPLNALQHVVPSLAARTYRRGGADGLWALMRKMTAYMLVIFAVGTSVLLLSAGPLMTHIYILDADPLPAIILFSLVNFLALLRFPLAIAAQTFERPGILFAASLLSMSAGLGSLFLWHGSIGELAIPAARLAVQLAGALAIASMLYVASGRTRGGGFGDLR